MICSSGSKSGEMASLRMTVTSAPSSEICWYKFQVKESKLSIMSTSSFRARCGGRVVAIIEPRDEDECKGGRVCVAHVYVWGRI